MINTFVHLMIQKIRKIFRLSSTARKIFWVAQIFDATGDRPSCPSVSYAYEGDCNNIDINLAYHDSYLIAKKVYTMLFQLQAASC